MEEGRRKAENKDIFRIQSLLFAPLSIKIKVFDDKILFTELLKNLSK